MKMPNWLTISIFLSGLLWVSMALAQGGNDEKFATVRGDLNFENGERYPGKFVRLCDGPRASAPVSVKAGEDAPSTD